MSLGAVPVQSTRTSLTITTFQLENKRKNERMTDRPDDYCIPCCFLKVQSSITHTVTCCVAHVYCSVIRQEKRKLGNEAK